MRTLGAKVAWLFVAILLAVSLTRGALATTPTAILAQPVAIEPNPAGLPGLGQGVHMASAGDALLVVYSTGQALLARRVSSEGVPLGGPFAVSQGAVIDSAVVFDGASFVVAWANQPDGSEPGIFLQRVTLAGDLIGPRQTIFAGSDFAWVAMAQGELSGVVLAVSANEVRTWVVDQDSIKDGATLQAPFAGAPSISYSDGQYLAVFSQNLSPTTSLVRIGADGALLDDALVDFGSSTGERAAVAPAAEGFRVVWADGSVRSATVAFDGALKLDPAPPITDADYYLSYPTVVSTPDGYLVFVGAYNCQKCALVRNQIVYALSKEFEVKAKLRLDSDSALRHSPALSVSKDGAVVAWAALASVAWVQGVSLDATMKAAGPNILTTQAAAQTAPVAAPGPTGWLVAHNSSFLEYLNRGWIRNVVVSRLDDSGRPMADPVALDDATILDVSGGAGGWLVLLRDVYRPNLSVVFVSSSGDVSNRQALGGSESQGIRLAPDPNGGWLLLWDEGTSLDAPFTYTVTCSSFAADGSLIGSKALSSTSDQPHAVDVVVVGEERRALWSDDKSQVAWQRLKSNCEPDAELVPLATLPSPPFRINYAADADQSWLAFERYAQPMFYQAILHLPEGDHEQSFNGVQLSSLQWSGNVLVSTLRPIPTQVREPQNTSIVLMQGDEAFASALEIPETRSAHLSAAKGDRMLFTYSANTELFGSITERVFAQVVQIVPGSPMAVLAVLAMLAVHRAPMQVELARARLRLAAAPWTLKAARTVSWVARQSRTACPLEVARRVLHTRRARAEPATRARQPAHPALAVAESRMSKSRGPGLSRQSL